MVARHVGDPSGGNAGSPAKKLVLIGYRGAGKSVLAAGLFAMNNPRFSVQGADKGTSEFLDQKKTLLQQHKWLNPTGRDDARQLNLTIHYHGHHDDITFDEYAGEHVPEPTYCQQFLTPDLDGAIILLNPSFIEAVDDLTRNKQITALKDCIRHLATLPKHPPVALVITAADRLESDLKERADEFAKYVDEIVNALKNNGVVYRKFEVSVSGPLASQNEAALNPQNVQEPFVWILRHLYYGRLLVSLKKSARRVGVAAVILLLFLAGRWGWEWYFNRSLEKRIAGFHAQHGELVNTEEFNKKLERLNSYITDLATVRSELCEKKHICVKENAGSRIGKEPCDVRCMAWTRRPLFPDRKRALCTTIADLEKSIDRIKLLYLETRYAKVAALAQKGKGGFTEECGYLEEDFREWNPLTVKGDKVDKPNFEKEKIATLPAIRKRYDFAYVKNELSEIIKNDERAVYPSDIELKINELSCNKDKYAKLPPDDCEWGVLYDEVKALRKTALEMVFTRRTKALYDRMANFNGSIPELEGLITECDSFFEKNRYEVADDLFSGEKKKIFERLKKCLEQYIGKLCDDFHQKQIAEAGAGELKPEFKNPVEKSILPLVPAMKDDLQKLMDEKLEATKRQWLNERKRAAEEFLRSNRDKNALEVVLELKGGGKSGNRSFAQNERGNPYLAEKVEPFVLDKMRDALRDFRRKIIETRDFTKKDFTDMKELAGAAGSRLVVGNCKKISESDLLKWLRAYFAWKDANRSFDVIVGALKAKVSYFDPDDPYFSFISCKAPGRQLTKYTSSGYSPVFGPNITRFKNDEFETFQDPSWPPPKTEMYAGEKWSFKSEMKDEKEDPDEVIAEPSYDFYPGVDEISSPIEIVPGSHGVVVRIEIKVSGEPFLRWLRSNPWPKEL